MPGEVSSEAKTVLRLLRDRHNVLLVGPPSTGKSHLMNEVREAFKLVPGIAHAPGAEIFLPNAPDPSMADWLPSPDRHTRETYPTVFNQNTKYRDFLRALEPRVSSSGSGTEFRISEGTLYRASEWALADDGAALVIIDELNRGPAVQIFGPAITPIENDKRLLPDGTRGSNTSIFELPDDNGDPVEYAFPHHLYVLAAMNEADTSVEALDVAFLRRWTRHAMNPHAEAVQAFLGVPDLTVPLPATPTDASDVYRAAILAWQAVNHRIAIGHGAAYQIGHGTFMAGVVPASTTPEAALAFVAPAWRQIRAHVNEVFFGSPEKVAAALNISGNADHPYTLSSEMFAGNPVSVLDDSAGDTGETLYKVLRAVAGSSV